MLSGLFLVSRLKSLLVNFGILLLSSALCFFLLELGLRLRELPKGVPFFHSVREYQDKELGWTGHAVFGNKDSSRKRIFFLGDSFTDGLGVPDDELYFSVAARSLGAEAFAYGGKGYGTLQEAEALRRYLSEIRPDLIVLQICVNDFLNNSWELERQSYLQNALLPRPYLKEDDSVELLFPRSYPKIRLFLDENSRLAHMFFSRMELSFFQMAKSTKGMSIEDQIIRTKGSLPEFQKAVQTTGRILDRMLKTSGKIPLVAFEADEIPPYHQFFAKLTEERNIPLFPQVASQIMDAEKKKLKMRLEDNVHWNAAGHRVAGLALAPVLEPYLQKEKPTEPSPIGSESESQVTPGLSPFR